MSLLTLLCFIIIFKSSIAANTLSPTQTLVNGEVLTSPSQVFELGFFSPGSSKSRFLGIRYKATPNVVVWVANRENPITGLTGALTLCENGDLILTSQGETIWCSNSSTTAASSPLLQLLDNGNLVVWKNSAYLWQSFDYPGNTRLPGMKMVNDPSTGSDKHLTSWRSLDDPSPGKFVFKLENDGLSQLSVVVAGGEKAYRTGPWEGQHFTGLLPVAYRDIQSERGFSTDGEQVTSISDEYNGSSIMWLTLSPMGQIERFRMNEERNGWFEVSKLRDVCTRYACRVEK